MATTTIPELPEQTAVEGTNYLVVQDDVDTKKLLVSQLVSANDATINAHINDPVGAHAASAISTTSSGTGITSATAQGQLVELASTRVVNGGGVSAVTVMTQAAYDALATKVPTTLYIIT